MARNGSGVYSLPGAYLAVTGQTITAAQHNSPLEDIAADLNAARPQSAGGTGAVSLGAALVTPTGGSSDSLADHLAAALGVGIYRQPNRAFYGDATGISGNPSPPVEERTWVGVSAAGLMTYYETLAHMAVFDPLGGIAGSFASRSSDASVTGATIPVATFVENDRTTPVPAWGLYTTAVRTSADAGDTVGYEVNCTNRGNVVDVSPYNIAPAGFTAGLWVRTGGETAAAGQSLNPASVAMAVVLSGDDPLAIWRKGLVFQDGAVALDSLNRAPAIVMPRLAKIQWEYNGGGARGGEIRSDSNGSAMSMVFGSDRLVFHTYDGTTEKANFSILADTTCVNSIEVAGGATGAPVSVVARGADTNVDLQLAAKGTGRVRFGSYVATGGTVAGHIEIKDASGTVRKLAVLA